MKYYNVDNIPTLESIECSLNEYLFRKIDDDKAVALDFFGTLVSFEQLRDEIIVVAKALACAGIKNGDIISICSVTTPEIVYLFYALDLIGAIPNMIDPRTTTYGVHTYIEETNSKIVFTLDVAYPRVQKAIIGTKADKVVVISPKDSLKGLVKILYGIKNKDKNQYEQNVIMWSKFYNSGMDEQITYHVAEYDENRPCVILHTGGTTGSPKCVQLSAKNLNSIAAQYSINGFEKNQKFLNVMPPFIAYGFACGVHLPLTQQVRSIIIPKFEAEEFGKLLLKHKPQHMAGTPIHYQVLIHDKKVANKDLSFFLTLGCGGDSITEGVEKEINKFFVSRGCKNPLCKGYGMTELSSTATTNMGTNNKIGSVGYPMCLTNVAIIDPDTLEEVPTGHEGEVFVSGPGVMIGYYENEEANRDTIINWKNERYVRTGDIGVMDEDGFLFLKGRIKRIIIRHDGFKIFATAIENAVSEHQNVANCSAVAQKDMHHIHGMLPVVFLTKKDEIISDEVTIKEVKTICETKLAEYCWPVRYIVIKEMPYTNIGKIDYRKLEQMASELQ